MIVNLRFLSFYHIINGWYWLVYRIRHRYLFQHLISIFIYLLIHLRERILILIWKFGSKIHLGWSLIQMISDSRRFNILRLPHYTVWLICLHQYLTQDVLLRYGCLMVKELWISHWMMAILCIELADLTLIILMTCAICRRLPN